MSKHSKIRSREILEREEWLDLFPALSAVEKEVAIDVAEIVAKLMRANGFQLRPNDDWRDDYGCHTIGAFFSGNGLWECVTQELAEYVVRSREPKGLDDKEIEIIHWECLLDTIHDVNQLIKTGKLNSLPRKQTE